LTVKVKLKAENNVSEKNRHIVFCPWECYNIIKEKAGELMK
jgi:hypothetical protein